MKYFKSAVGTVYNVNHGTEKKQVSFNNTMTMFHKFDMTTINSILHIEMALRMIMILREIICIIFCYHGVTAATKTILKKKLFTCFRA